MTPIGLVSSLIRVHVAQAQTGLPIVVAVGCVHVEMELKLLLDIGVITPVVNRFSSAWTTAP